MYCCISGCPSKSLDNKHKLDRIQFYSFPCHSSFLPWQSEKRELWIDAVKRHTFPTPSWKLDQRTEWIAALRRVNCGKRSLHAKQLRKRQNATRHGKNPDTFKPSRGTRICSAHFVGNKKSENPHNPAYIPKIFPGNNEYLIPAPVPEKPELPEKHTFSVPEQPELPEKPTFSVLPALQVVPIEPFVPEEVDNSCKDCTALTVEFSFWCVQCDRGPLCVACAECVPHDGHYLLRTPRGATHSQTETILAVIRQQLQAENLLTLYEINKDGVKVEIKEEPEELPPSIPEPVTEPDPRDPLNPLATYYPDTGEQVVEDETDNHYLTKRRRIMPTENNATQPKSLVMLQPPKSFSSQTIVKDTPSGLKTVLKRTPSGLKKVLLKPIPSGLPPVLKLKPIPSDSILKTKLDGLKRSQNVTKATSQTVLKIIPNGPRRKTLLLTPNDVRETQTVPKNQPSGMKDPQTKNQPDKLKIERTLLKVPLSELTKSKTHNHPSGLKTLRKVKLGEILKHEKMLKRTAVEQNELKATSSKTRKSQTALNMIPNDPRRRTFLLTPNDVRETQSVLKNQPSGMKDPQTKNQPGKLKIKRTLLKVPLSELTKTKTLLNHPSGLKTLRKVKPGEILKLEKIQKMLKGTAIEQNDPKGQILHNVLKGFSTPLKVTSEPPRNSE